MEHLILVIQVDQVDLGEVVQVMVLDQQDQKILEEVQPLLVLQY